MADDNKTDKGGEYQAAQDNATKADAAHESSYDRFMKQVNEAQSQINELKAKQAEMKEMKKKANAESQVAEHTNNGEYVTFAQAMEMIDAEDAAKQQYIQMEAAQLAASAELFGTVLSSGAGVLGEAGKDTLEAAGDSVKSPGGLFALMAGGALAMLPNAVSSPVSKMLNGMSKLDEKNELDDGVESKSTPGVKDVIWEYLGFNKRHEPGGTGPDAKETKYTPLAEFKFDPSQNNAFDLSPEDMEWIVANPQDFVNGYSDKFDKPADLDLFVSTVTDIVNAAQKENGGNGGEGPDKGGDQPSNDDSPDYP